MAWTQPKTNWVATDFFNVSDYNRWVNNIRHLKDLAERLFTIPTFDANMVLKTKNDLPYAKYINAVENNLEILNNATYQKDIGTKKTYSANMNMPNYIEFNRIESATLELYKQLKGDTEVIPVLPFKLGIAREVKE